jgi:hypothetical protein
VSDLAQRNASLNDMKEIWVLMRESAAELPFDVKNEAEQERVLTEVMECCTAEMSPLVVDGKQTVIGALLAKRDQLDWGFRNKKTINVSLAAVAASHRDQGVLKMLIEELCKQDAPVYVGVKTGEGLGLAVELKGSGFSLEETSESGELYKWEPSAQKTP